MVVGSLQVGVRRGHGSQRTDEGRKPWKGRACWKSNENLIWWPWSGLRWRRHKVTMPESPLSKTAQKFNMQSLGFIPQATGNHLVKWSFG